MHQYFFILGNTPALSRAELSAVAARAGVVGRWDNAGEAAILGMSAPFDCSGFFERLGGSVKAGEITGTAPTIDAACAAGEAWAAALTVGERPVVGASVYRGDARTTRRTLDLAHRAFDEAMLSAKKIRRKEGGGLRVITTRDHALSSVALVTNHILERGGEFVALIGADGQVRYGVTRIVQDFRRERDRDLGRPRRNAKRGMLPPKLARILVNLAEVRKGGIVLDPFCGSGTVLQEAMLLGYAVKGSDLDPMAVTDTEENLAWLATQSKVESPKSKVFIADVRALDRQIPANSVDAIVTEPTLGPPLRGNETPAQMTAIRANLAVLLRAAFTNFATVVRSGGRVVIALPVLKNVLLPDAVFAASGWRTVPMAKGKAGDAECSPRGGIFYQRADHRLAREILVLEK